MDCVCEVLEMRMDWELVFSEELESLDESVRRREIDPIDN